MPRNDHIKSTSCFINVSIIHRITHSPKVTCNYGMQSTRSLLINNCRDPNVMEYTDPQAIHQRQRDILLLTADAALTINNTLFLSSLGFLILPLVCPRMSYQQIGGLTLVLRTFIKLLQMTHSSHRDNEFWTWSPKSPTFGFVHVHAFHIPVF